MSKLKDEDELYTGSPTIPMPGKEEFIAVGGMLAVIGIVSLIVWALAKVGVL